MAAARGPSRVASTPHVPLGTARGRGTAVCAAARTAQATRIGSANARAGLIGMGKGDAGLLAVKARHRPRVAAVRGDVEICHRCPRAINRILSDLSGSG